MTEPDFPRALRIGYITYRVEEWAPRAAASVSKYGEAAHVERVIRVDLIHGPVQSAETLLHEIVHALKEVSPLRSKDEVEDEELANLISQGLTQVMRDNPALRAWLVWSWAQEG